MAPQYSIKNICLSLYHKSGRRFNIQLLLFLGKSKNIKKIPCACEIVKKQSPSTGMIERDYMNYLTKSDTACILFLGRRHLCRGFFSNCIRQAVGLLFIILSGFPFGSPKWIMKGGATWWNSISWWHFWCSSSLREFSTGVTTEINRQVCTPSG